MFLRKIKEVYKKKYSIRYYNLIGNSPYNDAYFTLGNPNEMAKDSVELIKIWTKEDKLKELIKKSYLTKADIVGVCSFTSQANELSIKLK